MALARFPFTYRMWESAKALVMAHGMVAPIDHKLELAAALAALSQKVS